MSAATNRPATPSLESTLAELTKVAHTIVENKRGAIASASTPEGRQRLVETRMEMARWMAGLQKANRALAAADQALQKALKVKRWGIRA